MMKQTLLTGCLILLALTWSCQGNDDPLAECPISCVAGKWYLEGFLGNQDSIEGLPSGSNAVYLLLADTVHQETRDGLYRFPYPYSGAGTVNRFQGTYNTSSNGFIEAAGPATTYIGGPSDLMDYEARFYAGLRTARRFEVYKDDRLIIYADSLAGGMLFFKE